MDIDKVKRSALMKAKEKCGSWDALGKLCGVKQTVAYNWYHRNKEGVPAIHVLKIEDVTGVSRYELRPDVFKERSHD